MISDSVRIRRFRGSRRRLQRLTLSNAERIAGLAIALFCLLSAIASAWLVVNFRE